MLEAKSQTRIDVTRDTKFNTESRFLLSTDYPGSPNLQADIAKLPIFTSYGSTRGPDASASTAWSCRARSAWIRRSTRTPS